MTNRTFCFDGHEYRTDIMQAIDSRLDYMTERFARTFVVRLDVRFPCHYVQTHENHEYSELMRQLKEYYTHHHITVHYVGVREQETSDNPHYHVAILFDGAKVDNGYAVHARAADIWNRIMKCDATGCIHRCNDNERGGVMIQKPRQRSEGTTLQNERAAFEAAHNAVICQLRYLAKTKSKGSAPPHVRELLCSRL